MKRKGGPGGPKAGSGIAGLLQSQAFKKFKQANSAPASSSEASHAKTEKVAEGEIDPLDAFMQDIASVEKPAPGQSELKHSLDSDNDEDDPMMSYLKHRKAANTTAADPEQPADAQENEYDSDDNLIVATEKKEIVPLTDLDHSKVAYAPFKKDFYVEHKDITTMSQERVAENLAKMEIKVIGHGSVAPRPVERFDQVSLDKELQQILIKRNYVNPTPIQSQALPVALAGFDMIGIAKTGSGKTVAFVLPTIMHILDQPPLKAKDGPIALIMAPTRELCQQIHQECKKFGKPFGLRAVAVFGGAQRHEQSLELRNGAEIVVATPGRLIDHVKLEYTNLKRVTILTIDEADRMLNMGFEPQVRSICQNIRPDRQTLFFSATFPRKVDALASDLLSKRFIKVVIGESGQVNKDVHQVIDIVPDKDKIAWLLARIESFVQLGNVLVFAGTIENCERLTRVLMDHRIEAGCIHGDKAQAERELIMYNFKKSTIPILIATDVAARGLDIDSIRTVVNYDVARDINSHVHRIGRTGRAGHKGTAYTLITPTQHRFASELAKNFEHSGQEAPPALVQLARQNPNHGKRGGKGGAPRGPDRSGIGFGSSKPSLSVSSTPAIPQQYHHQQQQARASYGAPSFNSQMSSAPTPQPLQAPKPQSSLLDTARAERNATYRQSMHAQFSSRFQSGGVMGGQAAEATAKPIPREISVNVPQEGSKAKRSRWDK